MIDSPLALKSQGKNAEDHHLHAICHPAQTNDEAQDDLETPESNIIYSLGYSEHVIRDHTAGSGCKLDLGPNHVEVSCSTSSEGCVCHLATCHS